MKRLALLAGTAALLGFAASSANADIITVYVFDFDFSTGHSGDPIVDPTISVGDTIHWVWESQFPHSTTSVAGIPEVWNSGDLQNGATFDHTFTEVGTWWYYCDLHGFDNGDGTAGGMSGTITVGVPEPATIAAMGLGLGLLPLLRRRKK